MLNVSLCFRFTLASTALLLFSSPNPAIIKWRIERRNEDIPNSVYTILESNYNGNQYLGTICYHVPNQFPLNRIIINLHFFVYYDYSRYWTLQIDDVYVSRCSWTIYWMVGCFFRSQCYHHNIRYLSNQRYLRTLGSIRYKRLRMRLWKLPLVGRYLFR